MERGRGLNLPRGRTPRRVGFDPAEPMLIPHRLSAKFPPLNGADTAFFCTTAEGIFFCKEDKDGRPIRATEMLITRLAGHVGILTPHCAVIEDDDGETYFGSLSPNSPAGEFEVQAFLMRREADEIGQPRPWLGRYLSGLYAFDLFISNPDRSIRNFLMDQRDRRLAAYDFASVDLKNLVDHRIIIEGSVTHSVGKQLRQIHGFDLEAALEMVKRLEAIPVKAIRTFLSDLPRGWIKESEGERLCGNWGTEAGARLAALSAGLGDGSLL